MSATEMITSPARTTPLLSTRSRVSQSEIWRASSRSVEFVIPDGHGSEIPPFRSTARRSPGRGGARRLPRGVGPLRGPFLGLRGFGGVGMAPDQVEVHLERLAERVGPEVHVGHRQQPVERPGPGGGGTSWAGCYGLGDRRLDSRREVHRGGPIRGVHLPCRGGFLRAALPAGRVRDRRSRCSWIPPGCFVDGARPPTEDGPDGSVQDSSSSSSRSSSSSSSSRPRRGRLLPRLRPRPRHPLGLRRSPRRRLPRSPSPRSRRGGRAARVRGRRRSASSSSPVSSLW